MKLVEFTALCLCFAVSLPLGAQTVEELQSGAQTKLDRALKRLADVRETIRGEKLPFATERQELSTQLEQVRREADRVNRLRDNSRTDLEAMQANTKARRDEVDYLTNLVSEFVRSLEARADAAELPAIQPTITAALESLENPNLTPTEKMKAQLEVIGLGLKRAEDAVGGYRLKGEALTGKGTFAPGEFILVGPITYFASDDGATVGISTREGLVSKVNALPDKAYDAGIAEAVRGGTGVVPVDVTLSNAFAIAATEDPLITHIIKGGIWMVPIVACGFAAIFVALFKAFELATLPRIPADPTTAILTKLAEGNKAAAMAAANDVPGPAGLLLKRGTRVSDSEDLGLVEEVMYEAIVETQPKVLRLLPILSVSAAVAPLLGLLGTVTGMIQTFNVIQVFGTSDPKNLSGGISEALITTEYGLIVAIPSLVAYGILSRVGRGYLGKIEHISITFINGLKEIRATNPLGVKVG